MKYCKTCNNELPEDNDRHLECRHCRYLKDKANHNEYVKYWSQRPENQERIRQQRRKFKDERYAIVNAIKAERGCADCGIKDYRVLDFDHIEDNKEIEISRALSTRLHIDRILEEIKKCEVVCSNCHRIRTIERRTYERSVKKSL